VENFVPGLRLGRTYFEEVGAPLPELVLPEVLYEALLGDGSEVRL